MVQLLLLYAIVLFAFMWGDDAFFFLMSVVLPCMSFDRLPCSLFVRVTPDAQQYEGFAV